MKYTTRKPALILLADGTIFHGKAVGGKEGTSFGEVCFNTGMTGYQEIFTDPSYFGQIIINTSSHIGNYGTVDEEQESKFPQINGVIINEYSEVYSRSNSEESLEDYFIKNNTVAIFDIDTRKLVKHIRDKGAMNAIISSDILDVEKLKVLLSKVPPMKNLELSSKVTTKEEYTYGDENQATPDSQQMKKTDGPAALTGAAGPSVDKGFGDEMRGPERGKGRTGPASIWIWSSSVEKNPISDPPEVFVTLVCGRPLPATSTMETSVAGMLTERPFALSGNAPPATLASK